MLKYNLLLLVLLFFLFTSWTALAQQPIPKRGAFCPKGYKPDAAWCIPKGKPRQAILKIGPFCPRHFKAAGKYCLATEKAPSSVIPKTSPFCPSGYIVDGEYCIK